MTLFLAILGAISAISAIVAAFVKYFPPKSVEAKVEEDVTKVRQELDEFEKTGRPSS